MDPRTHVAHALVRLLAAPAPLPPRESLAFRNRLLDETGGDFRPLVMFLLQLAEGGLVEQIEACAARGDPWTETHRKLALDWITEHYHQPEMVRWGVAAWGAAMHRCPVPEAPVEMPPAPPAPAAGRHTPAEPGAAYRPAAARGRATPVVSTGGVTRSPASSAYSRTSRPASRGYFSKAERQALASIGVTGLVAAGLIAMMSTQDADVLPVAPATSAPPAAATATAPAVVRAAGPTSPSERTADSAARVAPAAPMEALPAPPDDDPLRIARFTVAEGTARLAGIYRLTVRRQGVYGDRRCDAMAAHIAWNQRAVDTIAVDISVASFVFTSRPTLRGTVGRAGVFTSSVVSDDRDGTRSTFRLHGQLTPWGFEASGDTRTLTTLRWRRTLQCQFVASLSGERLP